MPRLIFWKWHMHTGQPGGGLWGLGNHMDTSTCHSHRHSYSSTDSYLMVFVILQICCAARVLKLWYGCSVPDTSSVADVYINYNSGIMNLCQKSARMFSYISSGQESLKFDTGQWKLLGGGSCQHPGTVCRILCICSV